MNEVHRLLNETVCAHRFSSDKKLSPSSSIHMYMDIIMRFYLSSIASLCLLFNSLVKADLLEFPASEYCFPQTSTVSELYKFDKVFLSHNLIVHKEDYFKEGDIYVGFIDTRQPETIWLTPEGRDWVNANDAQPTFFLRLSSSDNDRSKLKPIMPITFTEPIDVSAYVGYGQIWVGYGLKVEGKSSFEEMMQNQRFEPIWEITGPTPSGISVHTLCLNTDGVKRVAETAQHFATSNK